MMTWLTGAGLFAAAIGSGALAVWVFLRVLRDIASDFYKRGVEDGKRLRRGDREPDEEP
jgi:hypothetical protein